MRGAVKFLMIGLAGLLIFLGLVGLLRSCSNSQVVVSPTPTPTSTITTPVPIDKSSVDEWLLKQASDTVDKMSIAWKEVTENFDPLKTVPENLTCSEAWGVYDRGIGTDYTLVPAYDSSEQISGWCLVKYEKYGINSSGKYLFKEVAHNFFEQQLTWIEKPEINGSKAIQVIVFSPKFLNFLDHYSYRNVKPENSNLEKQNKAIPIATLIMEKNSDKKEIIGGEAIIGKAGIFISNEGSMIIGSDHFGHD